MVRGANTWTGIIRFSDPEYLENIQIDRFTGQILDTLDIFPEVYLMSGTGPTAKFTLFGRFQEARNNASKDKCNIISMEADTRCRVQRRSYRPSKVPKRSYRPSKGGPIFQEFDSEGNWHIEWRIFITGNHDLVCD